MKNDFIKRKPKKQVSPELVKTFTFLDEYSFPSELKNCHELQNFISKSSGKTHKIASQMTTITIASATTAGKIYTETYAPTSLYTILVLPTGMGKDMVAKIPVKLIPKSIVLGNVTSIGALEDMILSSPAVTHIIDEYGDILGNTLAEGSYGKKDILAMQKSIYSAGNSEHQLTRYSSQGGKQEVKPRIVKKPAYGICGLSTERQLMDRLSGKMLSDGFLNRFLIVNGSEIPPDFIKSPIFDVPSEIQKHIHMIQSSKTKIIKMNSDCTKFYHDVIGDADLIGTDINIWVNNDEMRREISVRWRENSLRLATALAGFEGFETLPIWLLEWSYSFVKFSSISFLETFENRKNKSEFTDTLIAVINWFKKRKGDWIPLTYIANNATRLSALPAKERNMVLSELTERDYLKKKVAGKTTSYLYR